MTVTNAQIDALRGEALATILLARHPDVTVFGVRSSSDAAPPMDLIVSVKNGGSAPTAEFGVEVKGYRRRLPRRALEDFAQRAADRLPTMPLCLFCIETDKETGLYAWVFEPTVGADGSAALRRAAFLESIAPPSFADVLQPITTDAVDGMVRSVVAWSRASSRVLIAS